MKTGAVHTMLRLLCCALILFPDYALAGAVTIPGMYGTIPLKAVGNKVIPVPILNNAALGPQGLDPDKGDHGIDSNSDAGQVTVYQNQPNAIINWQSFDIGADAGVHFDQKGNAGWAALNRIWNADPSQIYGHLTADGKIYLINQNGILFGPGSRVNVNSLAASALNIANDDFLNNVLHFKLENYRNPGAAPDPLAVVSNQGEINAAENTGGGYVFLMAPRVENFGVINARVGQIGLAAGTDVRLLTPQMDDTSRQGYYVVINDDFINSPVSADPDFGRAVNREGGKLYADGGVVGMHGNNVDQWGIIRSVTAFQNKQGQVELRAAKKITTGANSSILLPVDDSLDPKTGLPYTISDTFDIQPVVFIGGLSNSNNNDMSGGNNRAHTIELGGSIVAPSGNVALRAVDRVYLESGGSIDVSGVKADLPVAVAAGLKLNSVELRDDYGQKDGVLQGEKITTPLTSGSAIGDISQALLTRDKTAYERLVGGDLRKVLYHDAASGIDSWRYKSQTGNIDMNVLSGDIIVKQGASLKFTGGLINYTSGLVNTTKLLSGTQIYDIGSAPANVQYNKILGSYEKTYSRFGVRESYSGLYYGGAAPLMTYVQGYTKGGDAGTLSLTASTIVLDGQLNGSVTRGTYQNAWTTRSSFLTDADYEESLMLSNVRGLETPRAGTLKIGDSGSTTVNNPASISVLSEIDAQQLAADNKLAVGSDPVTGPTRISAATLNDAKLGTVNLTADMTIETAVDARIALQPGGAFTATARRIDHEGGITVPGGAVNLSIVQNNTSQLKADGTSNGASYLPLDERIIIGKSSVLDAAGERIDNSQTGTSGNALAGAGRTNGGSISVMDETDQGAGVFIQAGARVDVSGGYSIDQKGKLKGGNAGSLSIQGSNIELDGDLRGYALADTNGKLLGGLITLSADDITVAPALSIPQAYTWSGFDAAGSDPVSDPMKGKLYLAENRFDDTGFTRISLKSRNDLKIDQNTSFSPSPVRLNNPAVAQTETNAPAAGQPVPGSPDLIRLDDAASYMAGPSSFEANAAKPFLGSVASSNSLFHGNLKDLTGSSANLTVSDGASIRTTPGGSRISLTGPNVTVNGTLDSPAGTISVTAANGALLAGSNAKITAAGYNRPDPSSTPKGLEVNYQPMNGGNVSLTAFSGLTIDPSATVDVSGSEMKTNTVLSNGQIATYQTAGNPGSVSLSYGSDLSAKGAVIANHAKLDGLSGGSLAIAKTDSTSGMDVSALELTATGFDDLTFKSAHSLIFSNDINNAVFGRKLTLDAPVITGKGNTVVLSAPWIVLANTTASPPALSNTTAPTKGSFALSGGWTDAAGVKHSGFIDVIGDIQFDGFKDVTLRTDRDIRLSQVLYDTNFISGKDGKPGKVNNGMLAATGNLTLNADRIYPGNYYEYDRNGRAIFPDIYSDYTIHANGTMTLRHTVQNTDATSSGPVYSAGGSLTVEGLGGIDVESGVKVAAPLGQITLTTLNEPGKRIYLADNSVLTTAGSAAVNYGIVDANNLWLVRDKSNPGNTTLFSKDSLPQKSITLDAGNGGEVIARDGSSIDVSGGGSVFAYKFQPGVEGSVDPLAKPGRSIVFKADSLPMPGTAVYIQGGAGLSEGMYTLLPLDAKNPQNARYAFLPGAFIIDEQPGASMPGQGSLSKDGSPLIVGYSAAADTSIKSARPQVYSVRTASEVLTMEGSYVQPAPLVSGDAGSIKITGNTMILDGGLAAAAMPGFEGGRISLSAANITVQPASASPLGDFFNFNTRFDEASHPELQKLKDGLTVSADGLQGFRTVDLGDAGSTNSITIKSTAAAPTILNASIISLAAKNKITLEGSSSLQAVTGKDKDSGEGVIKLTTPGDLDIGSDAILHATHAVSLDANNVTAMKGSLQSDGGALTLKSGSIYFDNGAPGNGLHLTQGMWDGFTGFQDITLVSNSNNNSGIQFLAGVDLKAGNSLTLDAGRITGNSSVTLAAPTVNLANTGVSSSTVAPAKAGSFAVNADQVNVGDGDVLFGGFSTIALNSAHDLTFRGKGSLSTGNADLAINAARVTAAGTSRTVNDASNTIQTTAITAPDFVIYAGANYHNDQNKLQPAHTITISGNGNAPGQSSAPGGMLEFWGTSIDQGGIIQADGGSIKLSATGPGPTDGVILRSGGQILARGADDAPGGVVALRADNGGIVMDPGSLVDVSAGSQGDAGLIVLQAPKGGVTTNGAIAGAAKGGKGGSFVLDTDKIDSVSAWNDKLITKTDDQGNIISGGFTESLDLRARTNDVTIDAGINAHRFKLTADAGTINVTGKVVADGPGGGSIELYAMNDLNIQPGGGIRAVSPASGSLDPNVLLSSAQGSVNVNGTIDVSDKAGNAGGTIYLRALSNGNDVVGNDVNITIAAGALAGASAVYAEAVKPYVGSTIDQLMFDTAANYINTNNTALSRLAASAPAGSLFHLLPGIEVTNPAGAITIDAPFDLSSAGYDATPGVLTIRAPGDLNIRQNLTDNPSGYLITSAPSGRKSWGFNLVAGADLSSADYMAVNAKGAGNLGIANNVTVYTESAPIRFASAGDTVIGVADLLPGFMMSSFTMNYNLASFTGSIRGNVGRDLNVAGAVQTGTGNIDISVGRDLNLLAGTDANNPGAGAIRTTGQLSDKSAAANWGDDPSDPMVIDPATGQLFTNAQVAQSDVFGSYYWRYGQGGDIALTVGRKAGKFTSGQWTIADTGAWDYFSEIDAVIPSSNSTRQYGLFSADYVNGTTGLATMGGGNLTVHTGGDFLSQAGTFGSGDLSIYSGGDIKGRFLNKDGRGEIHAMGNVGSFDKQAQLELFNSRMKVTAQGELRIGAVLNPTLASDQVLPGNSARDSSFVHCTYTPQTSIGLTAGTDVTIDGASPYYKHPQQVINEIAANTETVLPATVSVDAGGDIILRNDLYLASSPQGNLSLNAGGDVLGQVINPTNGTYQPATILVSDMSPRNWYGLFYIGNTDNPEQGGHWIATRKSNYHGLYDPTDNTWSISAPLHTGDDLPITVHAGEDIKGLNLNFPKKAEVTAGRDIVDITYEGQNINPDNVSMIRAGRDISMQYVKASQNADQGGLIQGGPGVFLVQAGGSIDLGSLPLGIQEIGNLNNSVLGTGKSSLMILSGYSFNKTAGDVSAFFTTIRDAGDEYAKLMTAGELDAADKLLQKTRDENITPLRSTASGAGDINMTSSQIATSNAASDIFVMANGNLNLGKTALPSASAVNTTTGISTANGGAINIFAAKDINVQESRVMTFYSKQDMADPTAAYGDITVWSDQGSINAGRGSRTAVSPQPPKKQTINGVTKLVFNPPAVGSGLRAMTYGENPPAPGNVHLFAPSGVIDAGEAGIAGSSIILAALKVTNAANISFGAGSIGVPQQSAAATNIGALSGAGGLAQNSQLTSDAGGLGVSRAQASQMVEDIIAKWLDVKVVDFVEDENQE